MNRDLFARMCVGAVQREINIFEQKDCFSVQFEELLSDISNSQKISATVSVSFTQGKCKRKHIIPICWQNGWGIGFESDGNFNALKSSTLLQNMYVDLAVNRVN